LGERKAIALRARMTNRHGVLVYEARQQAAVEKRQRTPVFAPLPQCPCGSTDVMWQAFGADVEITHMCRCSVRRTRGLGRKHLCESKQIKCEQPDEYRDDDPDQHPATLRNPAEKLADPLEPAGPFSAFVFIVDPAKRAYRA